MSAISRIRDHETGRTSHYKSSTLEESIEFKTQRTIIEQLLKSTNLPPEELSAERLASEAQIVLGAGTDTTSYTLSMISFHLLNHPEMRARLKAELSVAMATSGRLPTWQELEKLPYLVLSPYDNTLVSKYVTDKAQTAVINEGFR